MSVRLGVIRVLTIEDPAVLHAHGRRMKQALPDIDVVTVCIPEQPLGVFDEETEAVASVKVLEQGLWLQTKGVQAVVVTCMADPGVDLLQQRLSIPAVGSGAAGAAVALAFDKVVGVLGITEDVPEAVSRVLRHRKVVSAVPDGVRTTVDLLSSAGRQSALKAARRLRDEGAEIILFGCTGMSTIGLTPDIESTVGLPVIDPVVAGGVLAVHAANAGRGLAAPKAVAPGGR